ncbi:MAG: hypothetical protein ACREOI_28630 [bacterium]
MPDECLVRAGVGQISKEKLAEAAARAEANGFPHGVSARAASGMTGEQLASAFRNKKFIESTIEAAEAVGFRVHRTPAALDPFHVTIELPKPVTEEVVKKFNSLFSKPRPNPSPRK